MGQSTYLKTAFQIVGKGFLSFQGLWHVRFNLKKPF